jgi:hypothetical protein
MEDYRWYFIRWNDRRVFAAADKQEKKEKEEDSIHQRGVV